MVFLHLAKVIANEILVRHMHFRKVYGNNLLNLSSILVFFPSGIESWASFRGVQVLSGKIQRF